MDLCGFGGNLQHFRSGTLLGSGLREKLSDSGFLRRHQLEHDLQHDHGARRHRGFERFIRNGSLREDVWDGPWDALWLFPFRISSFFRPCAGVVYRPERHKCRDFLAELAGGLVSADVTHPGIARYLEQPDDGSLLPEFRIRCHECSQCAGTILPPQTESLNDSFAYNL